MNKIRIVVCGKEFLLNSEDTQEHYDMLADKTDSKIYEIAGSSSSLNLQSAAILTALSAYDEAYALNSAMDNLRKQVAEYASYATDLRERLEASEAANIEAEAKIEELNRKITEQQNEIKVNMLKSTIENSLHERNGNK